MRPFSITTKTNDLLFKLSRLKVFHSRKPSGKRLAEYIALVHAVVESDELAAAPVLANSLLAPEPVSGIARTGIVQLVANRSSNQLTLLDQQSRRHSPYSTPVWQWHSLTPDDVARLGTTAELLGILSFHPNGRVRESTVNLLAASDSSLAIIFLLLRVNDWVEPIREQALAAIQQCFQNNKIKNLLEYLPLVFGLAKKRRADHSGLQQQFERLLLADQAQLAEALNTENFRTRRIAYDMVWRAGNNNQQAVSEAALRDTDPLVRLGAAKHIAKMAVTTEPPATLKLLSTDIWSAIRMVAARAAIALGDDALLWRMVTDSSRMIRLAARFHLGSVNPDLSSKAFVDIYRNELLNGNAVVGLEGLAEVGQQEDIKYVTPHLNSSSPKVVEAALYTRAKLFPENHQADYLHYLGNAHPRISRTAARLLMARVDPPTRNSCKQLIEDDGVPGHVRLNAYRLLVNQGKWAKLIEYLKVLHHRDSAIQKLAQTDLNRWLAEFNETFTPPTFSELAELRTLVNAIALDGESKNTLEFILSTS